MNISDVAKKTGLTSKAIRFYEEKGLVTAPIRTDNGYRSYSARHIEELTLLRQARQVGFNLDECRELVALFNDPARHSADVKARTLQKVADIEKHISELGKCANGCWRWRINALAMKAQTARSLIIWQAAATKASA